MAAVTVEMATSAHKKVVYVKRYAHHADRAAGHVKREEGVHSMMVVLLVVRYKDDRFIDLVLAVAASNSKRWDGR